MKVFADRDFQEACNGLLTKETKKGLFAKPSVEVPGPEDYRMPRSRWKVWQTAHSFPSWLATFWRTIWGIKCTEVTCTSDLSVIA